MTSIRIMRGGAIASLGAVLALSIATLPAVASGAETARDDGAHAANAVQLPTAVEGPITGPGAMHVATRPGPEGTNFDEVGYEESEYFVSGIAGPSDQPYAVRVMVRAPIDPADASGVVVYEPTHRGGKDLICQFARYGIAQAGDICVGVTARPINLSNPRTVGAGLQDFNPARYAGLQVEADQTNEVLAQVAWLLKSEDPASPLAGAYPVDRIVMGGTSDSSGAVRGYMGAAHNVAFRTPDGGPVVDGFFVTSTNGDDPIERVDVPTIQLPTQFEVTNSVAWRRPDGDEPGNQFRAYEVAGMAHNESRDQPHAFADCEGTVSAFPFGALTFMGLQHLIDWTYGVIPPHGEPIATDENGAIVLDDAGNARGGIRSAYLDVPATNIAIPNAGPGLCYQTGNESALSDEYLQNHYRNSGQFTSAFKARLAELTELGWWPAEYTERYGMEDAKRLGALVREATVPGQRG